jgi:hypothetical protein
LSVRSLSWRSLGGSFSLRSLAGSSSWRSLVRSSSWRLSVRSSFWRSLGRSLGWLLPVAAGAVPRLYRLGGQVLGGDELHAVRAALTHPLGALLATYQPTDTSLPLAALDRLLIDHGVPLSEALLRLPALAAGLLAPPLLALALALSAPGLSRGTRLLWCWFLALSPLLVLYSRIARSYMPVVLLSAGAVLAFARWWPPAGELASSGRGRPGAALAYVLLAALAVWFHLGAAPFVAAPLLFALGDLGAARLARRRTAAPPGQRPGPPAGRGLARLALLAAALAAACGLFLLPARASLAALVAAKRQAQSVSAGTWMTVLRLEAGTASPLLAALFWAAAAGGLLVLLRRRPRLALYTATLVAVHLLGILLLSPLGLGNALVLDRYLLPALPVVLLWVAAGLAPPAGRACASPSGASPAGSLPTGSSPAGAPSAGVPPPGSPPAAAFPAGSPHAGSSPAGPPPAASRWRAARGLARVALGRSGAVRAALRLRGWGFLAVLVVAGPFADAEVRDSSFLGHNDLVAFARPRATVPAGALPLPYRAFGGGAVVELPWPPAWDFGRSFYAYQEVHGLPVLVAPPPGVLDDPRLALRTHVAIAAPDPAAFVASRERGARWVAVHLDLGAEEERLSGAPARPQPERLRLHYRRAGEQIAALLTRLWGPPTFADRAVAAWDLSCRRAGHVRGSPRLGGHRPSPSPLQPPAAARGGGNQSAAPPARASAASSSPAMKLRGR